MENHLRTRDCRLPVSRTPGDFPVEHAQTHPPATGWGFEQILDHIDIGIVMLDLENEQIEYRNPVFYKILHHEPYSDDFQALHRLFLDASQPSPGLCHAGQSGKVKLDERLLGFSVYHIGDRYCCLFIRDITERKRLETIAQAVNSIDNLGFIFSGIRHEIGNPLNSLKMTLSVLKQNLGRFSEKSIEEYVERSLGDIGRVEYLLKSLKSFSMFEVVNVVDVPFGKFMETFFSLALRDLQRRNISLRHDPDFDLGPVRIDPRAMNQVLLNIVANAAEALENRMDGEIVFSATLGDQLVWLTVSDNGCGISPKQKKHLFQPFNSNKPSGNGLGLVITRKLLTLMGCSIDIESRVGKGTRVRISLPTAPGDSDLSTTRGNNLAV
ncbi:MAG: two-component system sensor histidine kinase NtrB [Desulforhopalus sp.]